MKSDGKYKIRRAGLAAAAVIAAVILIYILKLLAGGGDAPLNEGIPNRLVSYNDNVLLVSSDGLQLSNSAGGCEWSVSAPNSNAIVKTRGKYVLLADLLSNKLSLIYGGSIAGEFAPATDLVSASVNKRGEMAVLCDEDGYKGAAVLLDKNGNEKFRWHFGEGYPIDIDISENGRKMVVSLIMTDGARAYSEIVVLDARSNEILFRNDLEDSVAGTVEFTDSGRIIAVADNKIVCYEKKGALRYEIGFGGREVSDFSIENENCVAIALVNSKNNTTLEMYSNKGVLRGSFEADGELKNLTVRGDTVVASLMREIYSISPHGKLKSTELCDHEIKDLCLFGGAKRVFALGGSGKYSIIKI